MKISLLKKKSGTNWDYRFDVVLEILINALKHESEIRNSGACVVQLVKRLTSVQVMISWFIGLSPTLGSMLMVHSLLGILSPSLSAPPLLSLSLYLNKL